MNERNNHFLFFAGKILNFVDNLSCAHVKMVMELPVYANFGFNSIGADLFSGGSATMA